MPNFRWIACPHDHGYGYVHKGVATVTGPHGWNIITWTWGRVRRRQRGGHDIEARKVVWLGRKKLAKLTKLVSPNRLAISANKCNMKKVIVIEARQSYE